MVCIKIDNVTFFIYTGIEDLVVPVSFNYNIEFKKAKREFYDYCWTIKRNKDDYIVYKDVRVVPFSKLEFNGVIEFKAPPTVEGDTN